MCRLQWTRGRVRNRDCGGLRREGDCPTTEAVRRNDPDPNFRGSTGVVWPDCGFDFEHKKLDIVWHKLLPVIVNISNYVTYSLSLNCLLY